MELGPQLQANFTSSSRWKQKKFYVLASQDGHEPRQSTSGPLSRKKEVAYGSKKADGGRTRRG